MYCIFDTLYLSDNPAPITIDELAHGIKDEGWILPVHGLLD
jgi:hypothetical protein